MIIVPFRRGCLFVLVILLGGCGKPAATLAERKDTGAEQVARDFFEALLSEDWAKAYATLDPESKAWCDKKQFEELARQYRAQIGFAPTEVHVAANETGDTASAIANFKGLSGSTIKHFKDGTSLRRTGASWMLVLRQNFGKNTGKSAPEDKVTSKS